jgi:DNA-binding CsgD family transcriptional regulator
VRSWGLSVQEQEELWRRWRQGESLRLIARRLGKRGPSVRAFVLQTGGVQQHPPRRAHRCLSMAEREEISRGVAAGEPCRQIAARLGRAPSTVSRELARNGGRAAIGLRPLTPLPTGGPSGPRRPSSWPSLDCGR